MSKASEVSGGAPARAFSSDPVAVYRFVDAFFGSLCAAGVEHVVVSPGSRSTPLALGAERTSGLRTWVQLDERSAGFFALGLAKASRRPVALVCTSGTAAANYLPAVVEAHYTRAPLVVLTADRPPELRDWGVGQTIDQPGLYGRYPRWTVEVPIPAAGDDALRYARRLAARAAEHARGEPAGPVHLNWPLREPLEPPNGGPPRITPDRADDPGLRFSRAELVAADADVEALLDRVRTCERGLICVGPIDAEPDWCDAVRRFAEISGWPVLADPASSLRSGGVAESILTMGDAFTRAPGFGARMQPEIVLRLGATPVSKAQRLWLEGVSPDEVWWLDEGGDWGEPSHRATRVVRGGAASLLERVARALPGPIRDASPWLRELTRAEASARRAFEDWVGEERSHGARSTPLSGLSAVRRIVEALPPRARLFASNSMSVRLLDLALAPRAAPLRVLVNRGASGIDGITSTALGMAATAAADERSVLITGDLAFLHDLGGLWLAAHEDLDLTIVVLDDDGGGIFSFLPVARQGESAHFDRLFRTPHGLDLGRAAALFGLDHQRVEDATELDAAFDRALSVRGVSILHVPLDARHEAASFREAIARMIEAVDTDVTR